MELQKVPGLDFEDLGLIAGIVIHLKFKVQIFARYDGLSCPKMHLWSYVRRIQPHTSDKNLWVHFFQDSLSGTQLDWFYKLERSEYVVGRIWQLLFIANISITLTWHQPVLSCRVWEWPQVRDLRHTPRSGTIWMEECSHLFPIENLLICS